MLSAKIKRRLGYALFALVSFVVSLYATFPADVLAERIFKEMELETRGAWTGHAREARLWRGTGLVLDGVSLKPAEGAPIELDSVRARLRLMPLLIFRPSVYVQVSMGEGLIELWLTRKHAALATALEIQHLDVAKPPLLSKLTGIVSTGVVDAHGELIVPQDVRQMEGSLEATLAKLSVGPGNVKGISLPTIAAGDIELAMELGEGHVKLTKFQQGGGSLKLETQAKLQLSGTLMASPLDSCMRLRFDEGFLNQNSKLKTMLTLAEVQLKKDTEGFLNIPLQGPLSNLQLRPGLCPKK